MRRSAGGGDDDLQSPRLSLLGILKKPVGSAMRRNDPRFVGDGELPQQLNARKKDFVVALASHDHADGRRGMHADGRRGVHGFDYPIPRRYTFSSRRAVSAMSGKRSAASTRIL